MGATTDDRRQTEEPPTRSRSGATDGAAPGEPAVGATPVARSSALSGGTGWRTAKERGSVLGIKVTVLIATAFGRWPVRLLGRAIALYYTLFSKAARQAVFELRRRLSERPSFGAAYRTIRNFVYVTIDALFLIQGKTHHFTVSRDGHEHLAKLRDAGQGAILLGAHLGSFYAMRMQSLREALPVHPVVYTHHARRINEVLEELDPEGTARLIEMPEGDGSVDFMLRIRQKLEQGGLIAILGDRVHEGAKTVEVEFLGGTARLPAGPYILASMLKAPVFFTAGLYRDPAHYELYCIPFAERIELPRRDRPGAIQRYAQAYADQVAAMVRKAPDNWFNFYDFWSDENGS
jgi:predicted LPLAT superfamily acyltransferase